MDQLASIFAEPVARFGATTITLGQAVAAGGILLGLLLMALAVALWRSSLARAAAATEAAERAREAQAQMAALAQAQAEMQGRLGAVAEVFGARQAELTQSISQRLDAMTGRIGQTMSEQTRTTHESLTRLQERLAVIDTAQTNIQSLAGKVVEVQAVLSN